MRMVGPPLPMLSTNHVSMFEGLVKLILWQVFSKVYDGVVQLTTAVRIITSTRGHVIKHTQSLPTQGRGQWTSKWWLGQSDTPCFKVPEVLSVAALTGLQIGVSMEFR